MPNNEKLKSEMSIPELEKGQGYIELVWKKLKKSKIAIIGGVLVIVIAVLAAFAPFFSPYDPLKYQRGSTFHPPHKIHFFDHEGIFHLRPFVYELKLELDQHTWRRIYTEDTSKRLPIRLLVRGWEYNLFGISSNLHLFGVQEGGMIHLSGTDRYGRDLFGRILLAGRVSLSIALFGASLSVVIGVIVGIVSGYYGGFFDMISQRVIEFLQSFPQLPLWMALSVAFPPTWSSLKIFVVMVILFALLGWTTLAREVRGKVLSLREQEFILAAREAGASSARVMFRHIFPNCLSHVIVILTISIPWFILVESTLSFLGLGIQPPMVSWGVLLRKAQNLQTLGEHIWIVTPAFFIVVTVLAFNFLGDGLRDATDPYSQ